MELNEDQPHGQKQVWKCMFKIWGIPSAYKSGAQKAPFSRISQLNGNLAAYIFGIKP